MPSRQPHDARCISLISPERWHEPEIHLKWQHLAARSDPLGAVYRSPAWFDHMSASDPDLPLHLAVLRNDAGGVGGLAPLGIRRIPIDLYAAGQTLAATRVRVVDLLGGQPLVAEDPVVYDCLFTSLGEAFPACDGIRLADIPVEGSLFAHIQKSPAIRRRFLVCVLDGLAPYQTLPLPETFTEYLSRFSRKKRYNLRRQERLLREAGCGNLELRRWEAPGDMPILATQLASLAQRAKDHGACWREAAATRYSDLAARGLLRCYTLVSGGAPVAALVGYQFGATYTVDTTLYDPALARFSPGTTMVHMVVEDLLAHRPVNLIDFGYGKPSHEQQPPRVPRSYAKVLLLRRTLPNRLIWAGARAFRASVRLFEGKLRHLFGRK